MDADRRLGGPGPRVRPEVPAAHRAEQAAVRADRRGGAARRAAAADRRLPGRRHLLRPRRAPPGRGAPRARPARDRGRRAAGADGRRAGRRARPLRPRRPRAAQAVPAARAGGPRRARALVLSDRGAVPVVRRDGRGLGRAADVRRGAVPGACRGREALVRRGVRAGRRDDRGTASCSRRARRRPTPTCASRASATRCSTTTRGTPRSSRSSAAAGSGPGRLAQLARRPLAQPRGDRTTSSSSPAATATTNSTTSSLVAIDPTAVDAQKHVGQVRPTEFAPACGGRATIAVVTRTAGPATGRSGTGGSSAPAVGGRRGLRRPRDGLGRGC